MNAKKTIRKILFAAMWLLISGSLFTLLIAANNAYKKGFCRDYKLSIRGSQENLFVDRNEVLRLVSGTVGGRISEMKVSAFDLRKIESLLKDNVWVKNADLWFDNRDVLHISITEREPVARIYTTDGNSFYIDSSDWRMPLSERVTARVPVFTGFPERKTLYIKDSILLDEIKTTAQFIRSNPFWSSQVAQIDITPESKLEMIPVVGNHIVKLGSGTDIEKKFERLFIFYEQVLSKTGFDKYSFLDVQFDRQVIGTKKGTGKTMVDSAQLKLNVEKLLKQIQQVKPDNLISTEQAKTNENPVLNSDMEKTDLNTLGTTSDPNPDVKQTNEPKPGENKQPKAVMPKRNG